MASPFRISFDADGVLAGLDDLAEKAKEQRRPAAQAAAQVFYDETKLRLVNRQKTGNLYNSIYQVFSVDNSDATRATYHVSWNARKAPHGHLVEFGGRGGRLPAHPFIRPAFDTALQAALDAARDRLKEALA